jgi:hypothetical protein
MMRGHDRRHGELLQGANITGILQSGAVLSPSVMRREPVAGQALAPDLYQAMGSQGSALITRS